jgi:hypothetical protein
MGLVCTGRRWLAALTFLVTAAALLFAPTAAAAPRLTRYRAHLAPHPKDASKLLLVMDLCYRDAETGEQATIDARQLTERVKLLSTHSPGITASQGEVTDIVYRILEPWPDEQDGRRTGALRFIIPPAGADDCSQVKLVFEHEPGYLSHSWTQRFINLKRAHHLEPAAEWLELSVDLPAGTTAPPRYQCEPLGQGLRCRKRFGAHEAVLVPLGPMPTSTVETAGLFGLVLLLGGILLRGTLRERQRDRWRRAPPPPEPPPPQLATYRKAPPREEDRTTPRDGVLAAMGHTVRRYCPIMMAWVACVGPALAVVPLRLDQRPQLIFALAMWPAITFAQVVLGNGRSVVHLAWPALLVALVWWQPSIGLGIGLLVLVPATGIAFLMQGGARREQ